MIHVKKRKQFIILTPCNRIKRNFLYDYRSLKCLVLLGNWICDEGASLILQELQMYYKSLQHEEIVELRRRKFAELALLDEWMEKKKNGEGDKSINEESLKRSNKSRTRQSLVKRSKKYVQESSIKLKKVENAIQDSDSIQKIKAILGHETCHPFRNESFPINGEILATGNFELQYLDLSYNHLTKKILEELTKCLYYQNYMLLGDRNKGLLHLLVEGGDLKEESAKDWDMFEELLRQRQSGEHLNSEAFEEFVTNESRILRQSIRLSLV